MKKNVMIVAIALFLVVLAFSYEYGNTRHAQTAPEKERSCINSGGIVETSLCCKSASDFPNSCMIGACGCSPENSHSVKICECPEGKCFDGNICV
jgi:hypothetical protein